MALVIGDSSVLIHLSRIDRLYLLNKFFSSIVIPPAVWHEVVTEGKGRAGATEVEQAKKAGWLHVTQPQNKNLVHLLQQQLDVGEAEAIAMAIENNGSLLLIDEADARKIADIYNVTFIGTIGLLIRAHVENNIESFQTELDRLIHDGGFRISQALYDKVVRQVNS